MGNKYRLFQLKQVFEDKTITLNCWLPSAGLKVGYRVELEAYLGEWWTIERASGTERDIDTIHTDWNVGGIIGELERSKRKGLKLTKD